MCRCQARTYYVYKMYVPFQDSTSVPVSFETGTYKHGDIVAARGRDRSKGQRRETVDRDHQC